MSAWVKVVEIFNVKRSGCMFRGPISCAHMYSGYSREEMEVLDHFREISESTTCTQVQCTPTCSSLASAREQFLKTKKIMKTNDVWGESLERKELVDRVQIGSSYYREDGLAFY